MGSHLIGQSQKKWNDSMNDWLKKISLNIGQTRRMVYDRNEQWKFIRGNVWGIARGTILVALPASFYYSFYYVSLSCFILCPSYYIISYFMFYSLFAYSMVSCVR